MNLDKFSSKNFYNEIEKIANINQLSACKLAAKLGYPYSTFTRWRDGINQPQIDTIIKFYKAAEKAGIEVPK